MIKMLCVILVDYCGLKSLDDDDDDVNCTNSITFKAVRCQIIEKTFIFLMQFLLSVNEFCHDVMWIAVVFEDVL